MFKEAAGGGRRLRLINAYAPRAFTAIGTPDPVLASRIIAIPLVRTIDPAKGNSDPANTGRWPCDYRQLLDDLWATGLVLLPEAEAVWIELQRETTTAGREFEPWRAILAVARLFERKGVKGLEERIRGVMTRFREEKEDVVEQDRAIPVLKALLDLADVSDVSDVSDTGGFQG